MRFELNCPLCDHSDPPRISAREGRSYLGCGACGLVFMDPTFHLGAEAERARYDTHRNDPSDAGYRAFLDRLALPLADYIFEGAKGLDYGSGPGPTLSLMLSERGFQCSVFDPFYAPDKSVLDVAYDFVTCSEAVEHFFEPAREFEVLAGLLRVAGTLAIMTEILVAEIDFESWWYVRDPTHVCFYRPRTLEWIGSHFGWNTHFPARNVVIFSAKSSGSTRPERPA